VVGAFTTFAAAPIFATIVIGVFAGSRLEWIDAKYQLTEKLVSSLEKLGDRMAEVEALSKLGQYRGQEAQFIGQARLREFQPFSR
jgi:hypothetical protein